jgi:hypothetical protein
LDISAQSAADLAVLSHALDGDADLETTVRDFAAAAKIAVASFLGMTVTVIAGGHEVNFDMQERAGAEFEIAASLLIPLANITVTKAGSCLVLYAATPGAFVDLAADLTYALQVGPDALIVDAHLNPSFDDAGPDGLADMTHINQATGILIGRGHTPDSASTELRRLAHLAETTIRGAAHQLIHAATRGPGLEQA